MKKEIFGKIVSSLLSEKQITQKELSRLTGLTEASISRYISGKRVPNASSILKIAKALNTDANHLLGFDKED